MFAYIPIASSNLRKSCHCHSATASYAAVAEAEPGSSADCRDLSVTQRPCRCEELSGGNSMSLSISRHQVFLNQKKAVQVPMRLRLASAWVD
jgi:hypothetical protein